MKKSNNIDIFDIAYLLYKTDNSSNYYLPILTKGQFINRPDVNEEYIIKAKKEIRKTKLERINDN
jgi:hypothetical protein